MDRRIALPAGLALLVALAVVGMLSIFSYTAMQPAEASISDISQDLAPNAVEKLGEPFASPLTATLAVTGASLTINPKDPGKLSQVTVKFTTGLGPLDNGSDEIVLQMTSDKWLKSGFPTSINSNDVTISANTVTQGGSVVASGGQAVNPQAVTVDFVGAEHDLAEVTLLVPDMDTTDNTGGNGIPAGANVTIVFRQAAGIHNPPEGDTYKMNITTTDDTTLGVNSVASVTVPVILEMSDVKDKRGKTVVYVAKGIASGAVTFYLDVDGDRIKDPGEQTICAGQESDNVGTCDKAISNPPFQPGTGAGTCALADVGTAAFNCNFVSVIDGEGVVQTVTTQADIDKTTFNLEGALTASPSEGNPGEEFIIQIKDFPNGDAVTQILMGSVAICDNAGAPTCASKSFGSVSNGELDLTVEVPDGVPDGQQLLKLTSTSTDADTDFIVGSAELIVTPDTVVPNQRVSVIGTGYTDGGDILVNSTSAVAPCTGAGAATIGGATILKANINDNAEVSVDNGGSWSSSVDLPVISATTTAGPRELKITDCKGREGKITLNFLPRTMEISPIEGLAGSNITIKGSNFPAKNDESPKGSPTVQIQYNAGTSTSTTTATPDAGGNFTVTIRVPTNAPIPSTNVVKATYNDDNGTPVITTVTHKVPRAKISLDKLTGPAGTEVMMTATGFKRFAPVNQLKVGTIDVTPAPKPSTNDNGAVTFNFRIPGTDNGVQTVELDVGGTTASVGFTVTDSSGTGSGVLTPIADALAPLFANDSLDRAFFFNNTTKGWDFFINDSTFASANTLDDVASGLPLWVKVTGDQDVDLNNQPFNLTCVNPGTPEEDCWNLIVFP